MEKVHGILTIFARNPVIFGADDSLSFHTNNRKNNILVLGEEDVFGINGSFDAPGKSLLSTLVTQRKKFSLLYSGENSHLFVYGNKIDKFKLGKFKFITFFGLKSSNRIIKMPTFHRSFV